MIEQEIAIKDTGMTTMEEGNSLQKAHANIEEMGSDSFNIESIVSDIMGEPKKIDIKQNGKEDIVIEEMGSENFESFNLDKFKEEPKIEAQKKDLDKKEDVKVEEKKIEEPIKEIFDAAKAKEEIEKELGELLGKKEDEVINTDENIKIEEATEEKKIEEPIKRVGELNTEDLIKKLEAEINKDLEENAKEQEEVKVVQEKIEKGGNYGELVTEFNELVDELDNKDIELNKTKDLLLKYKQQLQSLGGQLNQKEIDFGRNEPIINTVKSDRDLNGFVLAHSKVDQDPKYKDVALDYVYSWLQKQTGVDIKSIMSQENESSKDAMSGNINGSSNSFKAVGGKKTKEDSIIQGALDGVKNF